MEEEWVSRPMHTYILERLRRLSSQRRGGVVRLTELLADVWEERPHTSLDEVMTTLLRLELWGYIRAERVSEEEMEIRLLRRG